MIFFNQQNETGLSRSPWLGQGGLSTPRLTHRCAALMIGVFLMFALIPSEPACSQKPSAKSKSSARAKAKSDSTSESETKQLVIPEVAFVTDFDDQDLAGSEERAWEFRPYRVAVWFCLDGSPGLNAMYEKIAMDVTRRSELLDPSGWDLETGRAPAKWRNLFMRFVETPELCVGFAELESLDGFDKIMIVCMENEFGQTHIRVREFDIRTQQWGPLLVRDVFNKSEIGKTVMDAISVAFMPLARIDRITEIVDYNAAGERQRPRDEVVMQVRSVRGCVRTELNEFMEWTVEPIEDSPVFIRPDDYFLPVIRVTDRYGDLKRLEPIEFTYLTINAPGRAIQPPPAENPVAEESEDAEASEDAPENAIAETKVAPPADIPDNIAVIRCSIQSNRRAPLAQRKSKHAQKLALVIRAPERSTTLFLYSSDKQRTPLEGFKVYSRRPDAVPGESNEYLGKTDWRGSIEIPPSPEGLRIILISRGTRRLARLPIIPGLYDSVESTIRNDETRLYAQGIIKGLENEILSLVTRRTSVEQDIEDALEENDLDQARKSFDEYRDFETLVDLKTRLSENLVQLQRRTSDEGELKHIKLMFDSLRNLLNKQIETSIDSSLQEKIQILVAESRNKSAK